MQHRFNGSTIQNEDDSVHALIERSAKHKVVYTPQQWCALIRWDQQNNNPYLVKEMTTADSIVFKILLPGCNWTVDRHGWRKNVLVLYKAVSDIFQFC